LGDPHTCCEKDRSQGRTLSDISCSVARWLKALPIRISGAPWPVVSTANVVPSLEVMFVLSAFGACGVGCRGRLPPARAVATAG
jgi:hypothetical protein